MQPFMKRINFIFRLVEHDIKIITSGPDFLTSVLNYVIVIPWVVRLYVEIIHEL